MLTDYLVYASGVTRSYDSVMPRLAKFLKDAGICGVVDLGAGAGGPWLRLAHRMAIKKSCLEVCPTDRYPDLAAFQRARGQSGGRISFCPLPVDASLVPDELEGLRTSFATFQHFPPMVARTALADAVRQRQPMAAFKASERSAGFILLTL